MTRNLNNFEKREDFSDKIKSTFTIVKQDFFKHKKFPKKNDRSKK